MGISFPKYSLGEATIFVVLIASTLHGNKFASSASTTSPMKEDVPAPVNITPASVLHTIGSNQASISCLRSSTILAA